MDNTRHIEEIEAASDALRGLVMDFEREQNEDSDEQNADRIYEAVAALDAFESAISGLVP